MGRLRRKYTRGIPRKYQIEGLWEKHHEIKRLELVGITSNKVIAEALGVTPESVCAIRGSELYRRELQAASFAKDCAALDVARAIEEEGPKCLELLTAIRDNRVEVTGEPSPITLRAHVAEDLLDRNAKSAKVRQVQGEFKHAHLVADTTISRIKERAREIGDFLAKSVEAEVCDESV